MHNRSSYSEKIQRLKDKIAKERQSLNKLEAKRKFEIGEIACKFDLHLHENHILEQEFAKLAEQLTYADSR